jgi:alanyl-tRNA synthetase
MTREDMPETERLYYADPYLRSFTARITGVRREGERAAVALDRTAFYPTGGGQPNDMGVLSGRQVLDVAADDGLVWHLLDAELADDVVEGALDWDRRFDHMQQHTGQHILSQAFVRACHAETVAFHLGATSSTIDLGRTDLAPADVARAESEANAVIDAALPVSAGFVDDAGLDALPLRKPPKVTGKIRVVQVAGYDWSACGGTHVANTAEVGLIKVTAIERRGPELRVTFLCGRRARRDYARLSELAAGLAARFTVAQDDVPAAVERLAAEQRALRSELADLESAWVASTANALWASAALAGERRVVAHVLEAPVDRAKLVAQALRSRPGAVVLLGIRGERAQLVFTRADDVALDASALLRAALTEVGGKGGGRPDWAQGGAPDGAALEVAVAFAANDIVGRSP